MRRTKMKTRYERRRDQTSRLWRKRRRAIKARQKEGHIQCRNTPKIKGGPDRDTSLTHAPLMVRILTGIQEALSKKKDNFQQHQAR